MAVAAFSLFDFVHAQDDAWTLPYEEHFNIRNSSTEDHPTQETLDDPSLVQTDPNFYRNVLENWELRDGDGNLKTGNSGTGTGTAALGLAHRDGAMGANRMRGEKSSASCPMPIRVSTIRAVISG